MLSIDGNLPSRTMVPTLLEPKKASAVGTEAETPALGETKPAEGVSVTFSGASLNAAKAEKTANSDIEESGLDENVQKLLKMIRQLKQQIAEKLAELQAIAADKSLTPEEVQAKVANVQGAISSLQAGLMTAQISLAKAMKTMSADQALKAASLSM